MSNPDTKDTTDIDLVVMAIGLFPDADTLDAALEQPSLSPTARRHDVDPEAMDEAAWDLLFADIMVAKSVVTL